MSPIIGLTDRESITPRFPRLGKLKKGGAKPEGSFGKDLEYFRFVAEKPEVQKVFDKAFGAKPASLHVFLPYAAVEDNFSTWKEKWTAGGLNHRCDGVTMTQWLGADGKYHTEPKPCPYHGLVQTDAEKKKDPPCDEVGRLTVIIPELWQAGHVGYVVLETHSLNDLVNIHSCLQATSEARGDNPLGLRGIEFVVSRDQQEISRPGEDGKRVKVEKWLVKIAPAADWVRLQLQAARQAAMLMPGQSPLALPASTVVDGRTGQVVEQRPWHAIPEYQDRFREKVKALGLTNGEALSALSVSKVSDYGGDYEDAVAALEDYAEWKVSRDGSPAAAEAQGVPAGNGSEQAAGA